MARYFEVIINTANGCTKQFYTIEDIVKERQELRNKAEEILREIKCENIRHVVYYRDERAKDGALTKAYFYYDMIGLTDDEFYGKWDMIEGVVGAVHRRGRSA